MMFPEQLKKARLKAGLTLEGLADRYNNRFAGGGLNKGTISKYENGKQTPLIDVLLNLAEVLGVSTDFLFGKTDWITPDARQAQWGEWDAKHNPGGRLALELNPNAKHTLTEQECALVSLFRTFDKTQRQIIFKLVYFTAMERDVTS
jgi:transcriptional regulator with XRE-family HTH domain